MMLEPSHVMYAYDVRPYLTDTVKGLYPDELEWWERKVSSRAYRATADLGRSTSYSDGHLWVPRRITMDELMEILALGESDVKGQIDASRIHGRETRRSLAELQRVREKEATVEA